MIGSASGVKREKRPRRSGTSHMSAHRTIPIALSVAGSDSGGGAGIQADLKTFSALGVHGVTAITCVTAQNPVRVLEVQPCSPSLVRNQLDAIIGELAPTA